MNICIKKQSIKAKRSMVTTISVYFAKIANDWSEEPLDLSSYQAYIIFRASKTLNDPDDTTAVIDKQMSIALDELNNPIPWTMSVSLTQTEMTIDPWVYVWAVNLVDLSEAVWNRNSETLEVIEMEILQNINKTLP